MTYYFADHRFYIVSILLIALLGILYWCTMHGPNFQKSSCAVGAGVWSLVVVV